MRWWQRRDDPHVGLQGFLEMLCVEDISKFTAAHDQNHHESNDDPCGPHACVSQKWHSSLNDPNLALMRLITKVCNKNPALIKNAADLVKTLLCDLFVNWASKIADESASNWINIIFFNLKQLPAQNTLEACSSEAGELHHSKIKWASWKSNHA